MHTNSALITSVCPNKAATCNGEHPSSGRPVDIILDVCSSSSTDFIDDIAFCTTSVRPNSAAWNSTINSSFGSAEEAAADDDDDDDDDEWTFDVILSISDINKLILIV